MIDRSAIVNFQEIDSSLEKIIPVLRVSDLQISYVAPNERSLAEANSNPGAWARAICANEIPVGFALLFMPFLPGAIERPQVRHDQIVLWRFMIDQHFQNLGFGKQALKLIVAECKRHAGITEIMSSYVSGPHGPEKFYLSQGFVKTGDFHAGGTEVEIILPFD